MKLSSKEVNKEELDETLKQLKGKLIHANKGLTCYKLLICFSSFDEDTFKYCINYLRDNCNLTNKALNCLDEEEHNYNEIRDINEYKNWYRRIRQLGQRGGKCLKAK